MRDLFPMFRRRTPNLAASPKLQQIHQELEASDRKERRGLLQERARLEAQYTQNAPQFDAKVAAARADREAKEAALAQARVAEAAAVDAADVAHRDHRSRIRALDQRLRESAPLWLHLFLEVWPRLQPRQAFPLTGEQRAQIDQALATAREWQLLEVVPGTVDDLIAQLPAPARDWWRSYLSEGDRAAGGRAGSLGWIAA